MATSASLSRTTTCVMPCAIADVEEHERAEIANAVHPTEEHHVLADIVNGSSPQVWVLASDPSG